MTHLKKKKNSELDIKSDGLQVAPQEYTLLRGIWGFDCRDWEDGRRVDCDAV